MNLEWWMAPWRSEANVWLVVTACCVAWSCALPGVFLLLRRMALAGDAISHSVLPGIVIAFLFTGSLDSPWLVVGAAGSGLAVMFLIQGLHRGAGVREDAATGIAFTAFFALGVLLLKTNAGKIDLDPDCVLLGSLETVVHGAQARIGGLDVPRATLTAAGGALAVTLLLGVMYRAWLVGSFDPVHARCAGLRQGFADFLLLASCAIVVVIAFQAVGAVLAVALFILPGATGLMCAKRLPGVLAVAVLHALLSSVGGLYLAVALNCNAAASIVLAGAGWLLLAWLFGARDGLIHRLIQRKAAPPVK